MKTIALGVMLMLLAAGCQNGPPATEGEGVAPGREGTKMTERDPKVTTQAAKPPLDLAAPAKTATATFALG